MEIDGGINSMVIFIPTPDLGKDFSSYRRKYMYVHDVLANCLVKLAYEKVWLSGPSVNRTDTQA